jgi:hypothetical protein
MLVLLAINIFETEVWKIIYRRDHNVQESRTNDHMDQHAKSKTSCEKPNMELVADGPRIDIGIRSMKRR